MESKGDTKVAATAMVAVASGASAAVSNGAPGGPKLLSRPEENLVRLLKPLGVDCDKFLDNKVPQVTHIRTDSVHGILMNEPATVLALSALGKLLPLFDDLLKIMKDDSDSGGMTYAMTSAALNKVVKNRTWAVQSNEHTVTDADMKVMTMAEEICGGSFLSSGHSYWIGWQINSVLNALESILGQFKQMFGITEADPTKWGNDDAPPRCIDLVKNVVAGLADLCKVLPGYSLLIKDQYKKALIYCLPAECAPAKTDRILGACNPEFYIPILGRGRPLEFVTCLGEGMVKVVPHCGGGAKVRACC